MSGVPAGGSGQSLAGGVGALEACGWVFLLAGKQSGSGCRDVVLQPVDVQAAVQDGRLLRGLLPGGWENMASGWILNALPLLHRLTAEPLTY